MRIFKTSGKKGSVANKFVCYVVVEGSVIVVSDQLRSGYSHTVIKVTIHIMGVVYITTDIILVTRQSGTPIQESENIRILL